jgi:transposase-like protein
VIIGATADGKKELVGLADGIRESAQFWKELLLVGEVPNLSLSTA